MLDRSASKKWSDFGPAERATIVAVGAAQLTLIGAALRDLHLRPAHKVRGSKWLWTPIACINFIGPIAYFLIGRKG